MRSKAARSFLQASIGLALLSSLAAAEPVPVRKMEGVVHGFLVLRSEGGEVLADGDLVQVPRRAGIDSRLTFRFRDGSLHDERVVFSQKKVLRLESYHLVQKGPSFPAPMEVTLDRAKGRYEVHHTEEGETEAKVYEGTLEIPDDAYNGMFFTLLKNIDDSALRTVSFVGFMPEPRVVNLEVSSLGEEKFSIERSPRKAVKYALDLEVTGLTGLLAKVLGKDPAPIHTWMLPGDAPTFVRFEGFLYLGGPIWIIELTSPTWSTTTTDATDPRR
jgi:hypothetical protein